ncbi:hypothetical protein B0A55_03081 [Friedmanniomyces simplex]|uniref:Uncharacterized protein n=1 Tax=Friedmanniomyces simplex TaxID=329884 RepID=A0A4V5NGT4_9PEZI|nr:hypothetical protein B0A55_03081 [Friedmanniomyces simplex]
MKQTLLTLPAELRNQIYSYVLPTKTQEVRVNVSVFPSVPPILQVYYRHAAFDLVVHHRSLWQLQAWIACLPRAACRHLRKNPNVNLSVVFDSYHKEYYDFKVWLGRYGLGPWGNPVGWWASAKSDASAPLECMTPLVEKRGKHGGAREADREPALPITLAYVMATVHLPLFAMRQDNKAREAGKEALRAATGKVVREVLVALSARERGEC